MSSADTDGIVGSDAAIIDTFEHAGHECRLATLDAHYCGYVQTDIPEAEYEAVSRAVSVRHSYGPDANGWVGVDVNGTERWARATLEKLAEDLADWDGGDR